VLRIVKEDGTVVNQYDYDAFGRVRQASPNTFATVENRYLFQGREWDKHGGFYYFRNRIYLPERGEFATPDMNLGRGILGELDGMATLTFCGGDPVNCIDPTGLDAIWNDDRNFVEKWMAGVQYRSYMQRESILEASREGKLSTGETVSYYVLALPADLLAGLATLPLSYQTFAQNEALQGRNACVGTFFTSGICNFVGNTASVAGALSVERSGENVAKAADAAVCVALIFSPLGKTSKAVAVEEANMGVMRIKQMKPLEPATVPVVNLEASSGKVVSPNATMRANANASGTYVNPRTGTTVLADEILAADHIVPQVWIRKQPGFSKLTPEQQSWLLNHPINTQGLPRTFNSSKGAKMPGDWRTYKGQPLDPSYILNDAMRAQSIKEFILSHIKSMQGGSS
jgi:RHS repeat-associated protein